MWQGLLSFFKPQAGHQKSNPPKGQKIYRRGQTMKHTTQKSSQSEQNGRPGPMIRGPSLYSTNSLNGDVETPPKTTVFESAGDLLNPPLPPKEYILDPATRPRTIFHDRVYHPDDIPAPPTKRQRSIFLRRQSSRESASSAQTQQDQQRRPSTQQSTDSTAEIGTMKIEEKIARAYHKDLSWRKVLVRLEPDAHNNLIVRRMFANAYGWPVVKHLCDTHFAYTAAALMRDEDEAAKERAKPADEAVGAEGEQVKGQVEPPTVEDMERVESEGAVALERRASVHGAEASEDVQLKSPDKLHENYRPKERPKPKFTDQIKNRESRTPSEIRESRDELSDLVSRVNASGVTASPLSGDGLNVSKRTLSKLSRVDSAKWSDRYFEGSDDDSDLEEDEEYVRELEAARMRGEMLNEEQRKILERWSSSSKGSKGRRGSKRSERSDRSEGVVGRPRGASVLEEEGRVVEEPGEMSLPEAQKLQTLESGVQSSSVPEGGVNEQTLSLTGVGLGKSVEEQVLDATPDSPKSARGNRNRQGSGSLGKAEQVALARAKSREQERE